MVCDGTRTQRQRASCRPSCNQCLECFAGGPQAVGTVSPRYCLRPLLTVHSPPVTVWFSGLVLHFPSQGLWCSCQVLSRYFGVAALSCVHTQVTSVMPSDTAVKILSSLCLLLLDPRHYCRFAARHCTGFDRYFRLPPQYCSGTAYRFQPSVVLIPSSAVVFSYSPGGFWPHNPTSHTFARQL